MKLFEEGRTVVSLIKSTRIPTISTVLSTLLTLAILPAGSVAAQESQSLQEPPVVTEVAQSAVTEVSSPTPAVQAPKRVFKLAWDTQFKYSNAFRMKRVDPRLADPAQERFNINSNDGDLNFAHRGLVSNRADVLSEVDLTYGNVGVRASAAGWLDTMYSRRLNANPNTKEFVYGDNGTHFSTSNDFQNTMLRNLELLDAFLFAKTSFNGGKETVRLRAGQFAQVWGQSLFFGGNGIAGGMAPVDIVKAQSVPNSQVKEIMRPVPQVSVTLELGPKVTLGAYYQFLYVPDRFPSSGSYFENGADFFWPGGKRYIFYNGSVPPIPDFSYPGAALYRDRDVAGRNGGQFGGELLLQTKAGYDLGFYAIRYNEKTPQPNFCVMCPNVAHPELSFGVFPGSLGTYYTSNPSNIHAFAMSVTKSFGNTNFAMEVGGRTNMDLAADVAQSTPAHYYNNTTTIGQPAGDTVHVNLSTLTLFSPNKLAKESNLLFEAAFADTVSYNKNSGPHAPASAAPIDPSDKKQGLGLQGVYSLSYRQVRPNIDILPQVGFSFSPLGKSMAGANLGVERGGNISPGVTVSYRDAWRASVTYTTFYGPVYPMFVTRNGTVNPRYGFGQTMHDRDFLSFSIFRSFGVRASSKAN